MQNYNIWSDFKKCFFFLFCFVLMEKQIERSLCCFMDTKQEDVWHKRWKYLEICLVRVGMSWIQGVLWIQGWLRFLDVIIRCIQISRRTSFVSDSIIEFIWGKKKTFKFACLYSCIIWSIKDTFQQEIQKWGLFV